MLFYLLAINKIKQFYFVVLNEICCVSKDNFQKQLSRVHAFMEKLKQRIKTVEYKNIYFYFNIFIKIKCIFAI